MKKCVCNVVFGDPSDHRLTKDNHAAYARRVGAEYVVVKVEATDDRTYCHWKYEAAKVAADFDSTLYLDGDCIVTRRCPDFAHAVPKGHWGVTDELWCIRTEHRKHIRAVAATIPTKLVWQANGGVMIMPPDAARVFHDEEVEPDWVLDQVALSWRLQKGEADYRLIDQRWNWHWMRHQNWHANLQYAFVIHHAGQSHFQSVEARNAAMESNLETFGA